MNIHWILLKLKLQYFGHLMQRANSLEKTLILGKVEGRGDGGNRMRWLDGTSDLTWIWPNSGRKGRTKEPGTLQLQRVGHDLMTEQQHTLFTRTYSILSKIINYDSTEILQFMNTYSMHLNTQYFYKFVNSDKSKIAKCHLHHSF